MEVASLAFRTDLMVLALGGSVVEHRDRHLVVRTPANPTYFWGNFVLFADPVGPGEVTERLAVFGAELPGAAHVAWGIDSVDGAAGSEDELVEAGFHIGRDTVLTATALRPPARRVGAELRPLAGDDDWRQALGLHTACVDPAEEEHVTPEFLAGRVAAARSLCETGHATWLGAFDGAQLLAAVGIVSDGGGLARFQGVETHPSARRRGLASALVHRAGEAALARGAKTLVIVADPQYHAIGIYRALGLADAETQVQLTRVGQCPGMSLERSGVSSKSPSLPHRH